MIVYKDLTNFIILGTEVNLFSETLDHGLNTIAEIGTRYHYLGKESPSLAAAIIAWQEVNKRELTNDELKQVLKDNHLSTSGAF